MSDIVVSRSAENYIGRSKDVNLLSVNQIDELLLAANAGQGRRWRKLLLKIKNLVVNYMKMEMEMQVSAKMAHQQLAKPQSQYIDNEHVHYANSLDCETAPLTDHICSRLEDEKLQLFGLMFAEAIRNDRYAQIILFENVYKFLGNDKYDVAVRQLKQQFSDSELTSDNLHSEVEVTKSVSGPSKAAYVISVRQLFETMMLNAKTGEGFAREMILDVKDAVQDYIKWEMGASVKIHQKK